ncbi:MAG: PEP-CTERM sorting domain-containing protein [Candidatus Pacebacteria bacterium]|nr:PEP-CTERM sorting domain-containing protein [Candidatus Paceibacterota bacterium]
MTSASVLKHVTGIVCVGTDRSRPFRAIIGLCRVVLPILTIAAFLATPASGAVIGLTATVTDPVLTTGSGLPEAELVSFDIGTQTYYTYDVLTPYVFSGVGSRFARAGNPVPTTNQAALGSRYLAQGTVNTSVLYFDIGKTVSVADNKTFFMYELGGSDDVIVQPLDSNDNQIGNWSLTINSGDYGAATNAFNITYVGGNFTTAGVAFTLADFTGDTGTLSGVTGLRFQDPNTTSPGWDPIMVGMVPEPSTLGLLVLGGIVLMRRRT